MHRYENLMPRWSAQERSLNPFETNLVVADLTRGKNALCFLAISPAESTGRKETAAVSQISSIKYEVAPP